MAANSRFRRVLALVGSSVLLWGVILGSDTAAAAPPPPPPASSVVAAHRYDHTLAITFAVPAAFYHPGAGAVVRLTAGRTPAASPTAGYAVPLVLRTATARPLSAATTYTFAVWIYDKGVYSPRRTLTTSTLADVTPPADLGTVRASIRSTPSATPSVSLDFTYRRIDIDQAGLRIVRNTKPTTTGGKVFLVRGTPLGYADSTANQSGVRFYYWAIPYDTSGHFATHYVGTSILMNTRRISGTYTPALDEGGPAGPVAFDSHGRRVDNEHNTVDEGSQRWHMDLPPGRYTVCQYAPSDDPQLHFHPISGCAIPSAHGGFGSTDWVPDDVDHFPAGSVGAVDTNSAPVSGVNLSLNYN